MPMKKRFRVGIAGYGVVGQRRRKFIDAHPSLETVVVSDTKFTNNSTQSGVKKFHNYNKLFEENIDILFVSLPNYLAPEVTIAGLRNNCHVFCEKPPGRNVDDVTKVRIVEESHPGLKLKYGFNHRYHENVRQALSIVKSKALGDVINLRGVYGKSKIISFESDWRTKRAYAGGGILLDQGIHMLDLMRMFCGEFSEVHSFISNDHWQHDVEDNAYALMRTNSGIIASMHSSATQWRHKFNLEIALQNGLLVLGGILSGSKTYGDETITVYGKEKGENLSETTTQFKEDNSWRDEIHEFVENILADEPVSTGNSTDALNTMKLVYEIYRADPQWISRYDCS